MSGRDERSGGAAGSGRGERRPSWRDDRVWQAGFLIGSALGAAATVAGRHAEKAARRGLVDWPEVERIAIGRLRSAPGTLTPAELQAAEPAYAEAMARIVPALSAASAARCRASSNGPASSIGRAGCGPTPVRSRRS